MQTLSEIRSLLAERGLRPRHRFGQNFLHDQNQLRKLIEHADVRPGDVVLEVGPGTGTLTEALAEEGAEVIACEIDRNLASILHDRLGSRITLIVGDCLDSKGEISRDVVNALNGRTFKLAANLPYNVASPLIINLLMGDLNCSGMFITIQKEVADRLLAAPGSKTYGPLSVVVQTFAAAERLGTLSPSCFWPQPEVTSTMVAIRPLMVGEGDTAAPSVLNEPGERRAFARFVTDLFSRRRKQLGTIFGRDRPLPDGIRADLRPEALPPSEVVGLWRHFGTVERR